jgi:methyl-accepting chemotaxis protein
MTGRLGDYQTTIASAVEEQTATTNEMSRSVSEAASGSAGIAGNIEAIGDAARTAAEGTTDSLAATQDLSNMSLNLRELISQFRI